MTYIKKLVCSVIVFWVLVPGPTVQAQSGRGYDKASYKLSDNGKFMTTWLISSPVLITNGSNNPLIAEQETAFKTDAITQVTVNSTSPISAVNIGQQQLTWKLVSAKDDIVDLDQGKDYVYVYALAEIISPSTTNAILSLGSDDGVKVWLNGKLVHENWVPRPTRKDDDQVALQLIKGSNQLLLKIQDMEGGFSFAARFLDQSALTGQLVAAASSGNIEKIKLLQKGGADIKKATSLGITPVIAAKVGGRKEVVDMLIKNGAPDQPVPVSEILADNIYHEHKDKKIPGLAVLVARDGKILYRKGFAYADIKNSIPVTPDTKFRIGSVSKQITAAAILKLQEKKLLSVQDKLSKFLPDFPRANEVTIHHLLTHTSGIHSYTGKIDFMDRVTKTISPDSLINYFRNDPYDFNPGERMLYNNSGYFLLGYIIEKVSGKSYAQYLDDTFFKPLGMNNTGVHYAGIKLTNEARGYSRSSKGFDDAINWDMSWAGGAGALYSTLEDLLKWNEAFHNGKVLSKESYDAAITPATLNGGGDPGMRYGYGLGLGKYRGLDYISHSGGLNGFITQLGYIPSLKMSVVMFSNTNDPDFNFDPNKLVEAFAWQGMDAQSSFAISEVKPGSLNIYTGRFQLGNVGVMMITTENDRLFAQLGGQPKFEIFPSAKDEFFWKVVEARIKFTRNEKDEVTGAVFSQNGQELKADKLKEEKIVEVSPAIMEQYTGKFKLDNSISVSIIKQDNKLFAEATGQPKLLMEPTSDTDFVIKEINAKLVFIKGTDNKFNKIKLTMNGSDIEMTRLE